MVVSRAFENTALFIGSEVSDQISSPHRIAEDDKQSFMGNTKYGEFYTEKDGPNSNANWSIATAQALIP